MERPAQRGLFTEIGGFSLQHLHRSQAIANDFTRFFQENIQELVFHLGDDGRHGQGRHNGELCIRRNRCIQCDGCKHVDL